MWIGLNATCFTISDRHRCGVRYSTRLFVFNCQADQALYLAKNQGRDRVGINLVRLPSL
jgi:hypothetical protein